MKFFTSEFRDFQKVKQNQGVIISHEKCKFHEISYFFMPKRRLIADYGTVFVSISGSVLWSRPERISSSIFTMTHAPTRIPNRKEALIGPISLGVKFHEK